MFSDMAENWLIPDSRNQEQNSALVDDPGQLSDEVDDTANIPKPKRSRNLSTNDTVLVSDKDSPTDPPSEASKTKRGRGRPKAKKDDDQDENAHQLYLLRKLQLCPNLKV